MCVVWNACSLLLVSAGRVVEKRWQWCNGSGECRDRGARLALVMMRWIKALGRQQALPDNWGVIIPSSDALNATQQIQKQHSKLDRRSPAAVSSRTGW
jgi:hypothetical protein